MKAVAFVALIIVVIAAAQAVTDTPGDNPAITTEPVTRLNDHGKCKVRPQTAVLIQKMRDGAKKMAAMVQKEVVIAAKRRAYIEQMTNYINDRIRELNKVKAELKEEITWIETTNDRIAAVAQQEKIARYEDITKCLKTQTSNMEVKHGQSAQVITGLDMKSHIAAAELAKIKKRISSKTN